MPKQGRETACMFSLYPMDSAFVPIILGALEQTDTAAVAAETGALSTVYRGGLFQVWDALRGLFVHAWRPGVHMALEGQLLGGPAGRPLSEPPVPPNGPLVADRHFPAMGKVALYRLDGREEDLYPLAEKMGLDPRRMPCALRVGGDIHTLFSFLEAVSARLEEDRARYALTFTLSVNSPTRE